MLRECFISRKAYFIGKELALIKVTKKNSSAASNSHTYSTRANLLPILMQVQSSTASLWYRIRDPQFKYRRSSVSSRLLAFINEDHSGEGAFVSGFPCTGSLWHPHFPFMSFFTSFSCVVLANTPSIMRNSIKINVINLSIDISIYYHW